MKNDSWFSRKPMTKGYIKIGITVFTAFLLLSSLRTMAEEKKSMSYKNRREMIGNAIFDAETERDLTIQGESLAKTIKQYNAEMMDNMASSAIHLGMCRILILATTI